MPQQKRSIACKTHCEQDVAVAEVLQFSNSPGHDELDYIFFSIIYKKLAGNGNKTKTHHVLNPLPLRQIRIIQTLRMIMLRQRLVHLHIRLDIETLPDLARVHRQRLLAAAPRVVFIVLVTRTRARDRRDRAVAVVRAVAERHGL
jgi:hypothetical protein